MVNSIALCNRLITLKITHEVVPFARMVFLNDLQRKAQPILHSTRDWLGWIVIVIQQSLVNMTISTII